MCPGVVTGHLDLPILAGPCRRLLELCVAVGEPLRQGPEPRERLLREPLGALAVQEPRRVPFLGVRDVDQGSADAPVGPRGRGTELLRRELAASLHQPPIHHGVVPEELHQEILPGILGTRGSAARRDGVPPSIRLA